MAEFRQGDVVEAPPIFYFASQRHGVFAATADANLEEDDVVIVDDFVPLAMITSQTCDIGEEDSARPVRPFVQVVPVVDAEASLNSGERRLLSRGRGSSYLLHLPALADGFYVADLRLEMPVEKGWLATKTPTRGFNSENEAEIVGERIARIRRRPALAGRLVEAIHRPLVEALKALKVDDRELWDRIAAAIAEVRVATDSRLDPRTGRVFVLSEERIPGDVEEWFRGWWDAVNLAAAANGISLQALSATTYGDISAAELLASAELDLTRFSP